MTETEKQLIKVVTYVSTGFFGGLFVLVALFALFYPREKAPEATPVPPNWELIACSECGGDGIVTYRPGHPFVEMGLEKPGDYKCSMCGGEGELYLEHRK